MIRGLVNVIQIALAIIDAMREFTRDLKRDRDFWKEHDEEKKRWK